jgi:hypothetical protein
LNLYKIGKLEDRLTKRTFQKIPGKIFPGFGLFVVIDLNDCRNFPFKNVFFPWCDLKADRSLHPDPGKAESKKFEHCGGWIGLLAYLLVDERLRVTNLLLREGFALKRARSMTRRWWRGRAREGPHGSETPKIGAAKVKSNVNLPLS